MQPDSYGSGPRTSEFDERFVGPHLCRQLVAVAHPCAGQHHLTIRVGRVESKNDPFLRLGGGFVAGFPKRQPFLH